MNAFAIVIGNSEYEVKPLINPVHDAEDFSDILKRLGFEVILKTNIDQQSLNHEIDSFGKALNKYDIGLFYFAGHGFQIEGENFLAVTNTNFESDIAAQYSSVTLNKVLKYMERANNKTNIIILDACRDNPFEESWDRSITQNGFAPMSAPKGTFIAYATSAGKTAYDGTGRNGLYTGALLKHILVENISIEELFKRVRNSVHAFSNGKQITWEYSSLRGTFVFNTGQLVSSLDTPYLPSVIIDSNADIDDGSIISEFIRGLKTHDYYKQNPIIEKISNTNLNEVDRDKQFLLGRNILQCADGGSGNAEKLLGNLNSEIRKYSQDNNNHILNGMFFEIYFNSGGLFRGKNVKSKFLKDLMKLVKIKDYKESFVFIQKQLAPYESSLFFIPGKHSESISFDITLEKKNKDTECLCVKDVSYEGEGVLKRNIRNPFFWSDETIFYESLSFNELSLKVSVLSGTPLSFIRLNTNIDLQEDSRLNFPSGYYISKLDEENHL